MRINIYQKFTIIYFFTLTNIAFAQLNTKVKASFDSLAKVDFQFRNLRKIVLGNIDLTGFENINYSTTKLFDLDFNKDNLNDLAIALDVDYRKMGKRNVLDPSKNNYRFLLLAEQKNGKFMLINSFYKLLNQHTEGVSHQDLKLFYTKDGFVIREFGNQVGTGWATDMQFINKDNKFFLDKATIYAAEVDYRESRIIKEIKNKKLSKPLLIDSVNYYDYFPFGFTDDIPAESKPDPKITITTPKSFFYQDASEAKPKKSFLLKGDIAFVEETKGDWLFIRFEGKTITRGWMHKKNVQYLK